MGRKSSFEPAMPLPRRKVTPFTGILFTIATLNWPFLKLEHKFTN